MTNTAGFMTTARSSSAPEPLCASRGVVCSFQFLTDMPAQFTRLALQQQPARSRAFCIATTFRSETTESMASHAPLPLGGAVAAIKNCRHLRTHDTLRQHINVHVLNMAKYQTRPSHASCCLQFWCTRRVCRTLGALQMAWHLCVTNGIAGSRPRALRPCYRDLLVLGTLKRALASCS